MHVSSELYQLTSVRYTVMKKYNVEMESSALLKYILKVEVKIPSDLFRRTCFDMLLSKSWIKLIHGSVVERKLSAENDKEVLVSVVN